MDSVKLTRDEIGQACIEYAVKRREWPAERAGNVNINVDGAGMTIEAVIVPLYELKEL